MTEQRPRPTVRRRRLSRELRALREAAGFTAEHVTRELEWSKGKLSRIENNDWRRPSIQDIKALLEVYEVTDPERREAMLQLTRDSRQRGWWTGYQDVFQNLGYTGFEQEASRVLTYEQSAIPGLLQTPAYAEAIVRASLVQDPAEVARRVELRMERQRILEHADPLHLWAVIDEAALSRPFGSLDDQREQLQRLIDTKDLEHVTVQVLLTTAGLHPAMSGSFVILEFPEDPSVVYLSPGGHELYLETPEDIDRHALVFRHLNAMALSPADSTECFAAKIRELK
ncbi:Helix-turn-helix domain-containing protein [Thermomonospora echinospora]|uniref:Helix-turn-helix domain-containing protein n=1 Tax=Thermomonospora echinospora TaxID=1992 RepID=A0A1H5XWD2_9ACTN|nr:helix-turn-helix transcriptional regulator [Thermomonospora echinospora]SEG15700.1 Helix-turn-helix domain-containing protein [Thermomonospora echinospora]